MRNLKKFLALVLAMMMVFSLMITVNAAGLDDYTDAASVGSRYATAVDVLTQIGIFRGTKTGTATFSPTEEITRAEMATIIYRVMTGDTEDKFIDLYQPATSTVVIYANTAFQGVVNDPYGGSEGSGAGWNDPITAAMASSPTYEVEGSFQIGQFITANILTWTKGNTLNSTGTSTNLPVNPDTGVSYSAFTCPARLQNAKSANIKSRGNLQESKEK